MSYYSEMPLFLINILEISLHVNPKYSFIFKNLSTFSYIITLLPHHQNLNIYVNIF